MNYFLSAIIGYLMGSINPSIIISKFRGTDIRKHGSGNAGATNTLRTLGKGAAAMVLIIDLLKGMLALWLVYALFKEKGSLWYITAFSAILGHNYPVYYGFRGGKGILTSFGVLLALDYQIALILLIIALLIMAISKFVSLGSVLGAALLPIAAIVMKRDMEFIVLAILIGLLAIWRHKGNIERLARGEERKLGSGK